MKTWGERNSAESVAYKTHEIWRVDNDLAVNGYEYPWSDWAYDGQYDYDPYYDVYGFWPHYYGYTWYW